MVREVLASEKDLNGCCQRLVEMANTGGGHDNITVIVAEFGGEGLAAPGDTKATYQQYPLLPGEDGLDDSIQQGHPYRQFAMKDGGTKPGADVKRSVIGGTDEPDVPMRAFSWWMILVVFMVVVVAMAIAWSFASSGQSEAHDGDRVPIVEEPVSEKAAEAAQDSVRIRVVTDIDGELHVDGDPYGPLVGGEDVNVHLQPGAYRFEARSEGSVVAEALVTVRADEPTEVRLMMPSGSDQREEPEPGDEAEPAPADTVEGAEPEEEAAAPAEPDPMPPRPTTVAP